MLLPSFALEGRPVLYPNTLTRTLSLSLSLSLPLPLTPLGRAVLKFVIFTRPDEPGWLGLGSGLGSGLESGSA